MCLILKVGVVVLALTAIAVSAQAEKLDSAALAPLPEDRTGEVLVNLPSNSSLEVIDALARRHRLTRVESQEIGLLGRTLHRWRIADGRLMRDVILAFKLDGGIDAQPNNVYILQ